MKKFAVFFFLFLVMAMFGLMSLAFHGCRTAKSSKSEISARVVRRDSVSESDTATKVAMADSFFHSHIEDDTTIGIGSGSAGFVFDPKSDIDTTVRSGNITAHAHTDSKGKLHIECHEDSLTLVVKRMVRDSVRLATRVDSSYVEGQRSVVVKSDSTNVQKSVVKVKGSNWLAELQHLVLCFFAGVGMAYLLVWYHQRRKQRVV